MVSHGLYNEPTDIEDMPVYDSLDLLPPWTGSSSVRKFI